MTALGIHLIVDSYFAGSGFPAITIWGATAALVAKVGLNLIAVPAAGAEGAVAVTSAVYIGLLAVKVVGFTRATGVPAADLFLLNQSDRAYLKGRIQAIVGV